MKPIAAIFILLIAFSINTTAQKVAKVTISTTASVADALQICKEAGKVAEFGSKDFDAAEGKITLWRNYMGGNDHQLEVRITTGVKDGKTILTLVMPHLPNTMGSYIKELKKVSTKIKLPEQHVGEYFDGIE